LQFYTYKYPFTPYAQKPLGFSKGFYNKESAAASTQARLAGISAAGRTGREEAVPLRQAP